MTQFHLESVTEIEQSHLFPKRKGKLFPLCFCLWFAGHQTENSGTEAVKDLLFLDEHTEISLFRIINKLVLKQINKKEGPAVNFSTDGDVLMRGCPCSAILVTLLTVFIACSWLGLEHH